MEFLKGFLSGINVVKNINRKNKLKEAYNLAKDYKLHDALYILERLNLSPDEKSAANLLGYLLKAECYAELGYERSARNCINVILLMSRWAVNPFYHYCLSDIKKEAKEIKQKYNL